jgi:hypothetical protein
MDDALRRRLDAALALLALIAFATLSIAFSTAGAVAIALVTGVLGVIVWDSVQRPTPDKG